MKGIERSVMEIDNAIQQNSKHQDFNILHPRLQYLTSKQTITNQEINQQHYDANHYRKKT